jgi:hypothetical protein
LRSVTQQGKDCFGETPKPTPETGALPGGHAERPMSKLEANPADVESIDAIVTAAYDGISGPAGKKRDWDRERSLFIAGARLIPTAKKAGETNPEAKIAPHVLDIEGFIARIGDYVEKNGFFETEIARRVEQFGHIAQVWSTYVSRHKADDPEPFMRGINSIQLFYDDRRWWIVTIYWQQESVDDRIPEEYLETRKPGKGTT